MKKLKSEIIELDKEIKQIVVKQDLNKNEDKHAEV